MTSALLLADADVVLADKEIALRRVNVLVKDGLIAGVGSRNDLNVKGSVERIDCSGLLLMPGLINAHTHLFQVLTRGIGKHLAVREWAEAVTYPVARTLDANAYYDAVLLGCADAIRNGTTAVVDHTTQYARFFADESVRAIETSGLRGAVARGGADQSLVDSGEVRTLESDLRDSEAFVRRWGTKGKVRAWIGPSGFHTCTPRALQEFKSLANDLGTLFHMHLAESRKGFQEAKAAGFDGEASQALALGLLDPKTSVAHAILVSEDEIARIASCGSHVVHCPTSNQILGSGVASVASMVVCGMTPGLATDGPSSNDSLDMVAELKSAALIHRVVCGNPAAVHAKEVFHWATEGGAKVLGMENLGRIARGFIADIIGIRIRGNPSMTPCQDPHASVVYCASGRDVSLVIVGGKAIYKDGRFTHLDVDAVCERVNERVHNVALAQGARHGH